MENEKLLDMRGWEVREKKIRGWRGRGTRAGREIKFLAALFIKPPFYSQIKNPDKKTKPPPPLFLRPVSLLHFPLFKIKIFIDLKLHLPLIPFNSLHAQITEPRRVEFFSLGAVITQDGPTNFNFAFV